MAAASPLARLRPRWKRLGKWGAVLVIANEVRGLVVVGLVLAHHFGH